MNGFLNWKSRNISFTGNNLSYIIYMREYTVYIHKNLKNDKYYVGCTKLNPKERWQNGLGYQKQPKMWSDIQNSDWNKDWCHGILGKFDNKDDALKYEAFLIAMLDSANNGYNTSLYGSGDFKHHKHSEGTKKKMSEAKSGENNPFYGKCHTEEVKKKISESHKGKINAPTKSVLQYSKTGEFIAEYPSTHEAERQTGCNQSHICRCCKGKLKSTGGYIWRYAS